MPDRIDIRGNADSNAAAKNRTEAELLVILANLLADQGKAVREALARTGMVPEALWVELRVTMVRAIRASLRGAAQVSALKLLPSILGKMPFATQAVMRGVEAWSWAYAQELSVELVTITEVAVVQWIDTGETPMGSAFLDFYFGGARAREVAATQTTKAFTEGERVVIHEAEEHGIQTEAIWHTLRDELVCEVCAERDSKVEGDWGAGPSFPPLHHECRCFVTYRGVGGVFWRWQQ